MAYSEHILLVDGHRETQKCPSPSQAYTQGGNIRSFKLSLLSIFKKERMWEIRSCHSLKRATVSESISSISFKKSNCEQIALYKRVTVSELLCISLKKRDVSDLLVCKFLTVANHSCCSSLFALYKRAFVSELFLSLFFKRLMGSDRVALYKRRVTVSESIPSIFKKEQLSKSIPSIFK